MDDEWHSLQQAVRRTFKQRVFTGNRPRCLRRIPLSSKCLPPSRRSNTRIRLDGGKKLGGSMEPLSKLPAKSLFGERFRQIRQASLEGGMLHPSQFEQGKFHRNHPGVSYGARKSVQ